MVQQKSPILRSIALAAGLAAASLAVGCSATQKGEVVGPDFSLSGPSSITVTQGQQAAGTITVTSLNGFDSATTLSASGLPGGVTASFSPNPVTPPANGDVTSTLTVTAAGNATLGNTSFTVTGTSGSDVHNLPVGLYVEAPHACSIVTTTTLNADKATFGDYNLGNSFLVVGLSIPVDCYTAQMSYYIESADNSGQNDVYDVGLYCVSGNCNAGQLYVHTGPISGSQFAPSSQEFTWPWTTTAQCPSYPCKLPAGLYAVAMGSTCTAGQDCAFGRSYAGAGPIQPFAYFKAGSFETSGLPSTFSPQPLSPQWGPPYMVDFLIF